MEQFKLRKRHRLTWGVVTVVVMILFSSLFWRINTVGVEAQDRIDHLHLLLSQLQPTPPAPVLSEPAVALNATGPIYHDLFMLALSTGRYELAGKYVAGVSQDRQEELQQVIDSRLSTKEFIQGLIDQARDLARPVDAESKGSQTWSDNLQEKMRQIVSVETLTEEEASPGAPDIPVQELLLIAFFSSELGFVGWSPVRDQLSLRSEKIQAQDPELSDLLDQISEYKIDFLSDVVAAETEGR